MKKNVDVTVIVPVYNVEEYLEPCLDSLLEQGDIELEVLMVNDGSTDSSGDIAMAYDEKYENFHCINIPNGGLGHARNYAVPFANGKYIIFMDSDDVIPRETYEKMFRLAERDGSDMTICNVCRFNSTKTWNSSLHKKVFGTVKNVTHISKNPELIYDTTSWNKLIRKDFYFKHNFQFPENILYEDIPVTIPMHILANQVSILNSMGYLWRVRDGITKSITQNAGSHKNLIDRLTIMRMLDKFFEEKVTDPKLHAIKQIKSLEIDLVIFINNCRTMSREEALEVFAYLREYIDEAIDPKYFREISILNQQKFQCVMDNDIDALWRLFEYQDKRYYEAPVAEENGRLTVDLPGDIFTVADRDVTDEIARSDYRKYIDGITVKNGVISIAAHIYKRRLNIRDFSEQPIEAWLYNEMTDSRIPLEVVPDNTAKLTEKVGHTINPDTGVETQYNYDGVGFKVILDLKKVQIPEANQGVNRLLFHYRNRFYEAQEFLGGAGRTVKNEYRDVAIYNGEEVVKLYFSYLDELLINVEANGVFADQLEVKAEQVLLTTSRDVEQVIARNGKGDLELQVTKTGEKHFAVDLNGMEKELSYYLYHDTRANVLARKREINFHDLKNAVLMSSSAKTGNLRIEKRDWITETLKIQKKNTSIALETATLGNAAFAGQVKAARLVTDDPIAGHMLTLASGTFHCEGRTIRSSFRVNLADHSLTRNFYAGLRNLYVAYELEDGREEMGILYASRYFKDKVEFETLRITCYRGAAGFLRLQIEQKWKKAENTPQKRNNLRIRNYPKFREEPINPRQIVFESMWGSKYSCNPQALYEYIDEHYPEYECIWSLKDPRTPIKGKGIRVRRGSLEYWHYMATAKYFVNNVNFETDYVKRDGQIEIQTMHGTPLKTLGLDVESDFPTEKSRLDYIEKNKRWNYLLVQGKFMEDKGKPIFEFEKEVLKTGYPRTDRLYNLDPARKDSIKDYLGIPKDKKIILYAPTWRVKNSFEMMMDIEKMREALADDYVLLIRLHHLCSSGYTIPADRKFVFNLNDYAYMEDLYLIADIMITDYSSVMFDYGLLNKPMIFFTYDMEEYCDTLRGLYVDFRQEAPGPIVYNTAEMINAILNLDEEMEKCQDRIKLFYDKYLTYENANSSQMIIDQVFEPVKSSSVDKLKKGVKNAKDNMREIYYDLRNYDIARKAIRLKRKIFK